MHTSSTDKVQVWDLFVRASHWLIAIGFFIAYFTEEDTMTVHAWAGYLVGALLLLRIVGGLSGRDTRALAASSIHRVRS